MVPRANEGHSLIHQTDSNFKAQSTTRPYLKEITRDLLDRQIEYDKINKIYCSLTSNRPISSKQKQINSKFFTIKNAVREARLKFFDNQTCSQQIISKNENRYIQQQIHSIALIAQIFRNQKSTLGLRSNQQNQPIKKWSLYLILSITIPMICLLILMLELKEKQQ
ncbi:unnamed protein product [Paramecium octaurelia]|uniref:Transmembrane protein n=1 Tax=Paramecium octaurelia TaxID=43137 RepID=A0A8S1Y2N0_PAROT|nr:unnamed protein product [Paramecium octaurelia]